MTNRDCPFCDLDEARVVVRSPIALALWDAFPSSPGHALVIPTRHVSSWFDATEEEQRKMLDLIDRVRRVVEERHRPDGFNIGINIGAAAGQTVEHLHVHLIPRYRNDVEDPRGGVRWVLASTARYWGN